MKTRTKLAVFFASVCMAAASAAMVAGCGEGTILSLSAPTNINYDGKTITWDAVDNASRYSVTIDNGAARSAGKATSITYGNTSDFSVTVTAYGITDDISSSAIQAFTPAQPVSDATVDEDCVISWTGVNLVSQYTLTINDETKTATTTSYQIEEAGTYTVYVNCDMGETDTETGAKYFPVKGTPVTFTKLGSVAASDITYDEDTSKIKFKSVAKASSYDVYVNNELVAENLTKTEVEYNANSSDFEVEVVAKGDSTKNIMSGDKSTGKDFKFLDVVTNVKVDEGILIWDEVDGATGYKVKIDSKTYDVKENKYSGSALKVGQNLEVSVKATADDDTTGTYFSNYSTAISAYILNAPKPGWNSSLGLDGGQNNYNWSLVDGATGYEVSVTTPNGASEVDTLGETTQNYSYDFSEVGTYKLKLRALAPEAEDNKCSSAWSSEITVIRPARPEAVDANFIVSDPTKLSNGFTVTCKSVSSDYTYQLWRDGKMEDSQKKTTPQFKVTDIVGEEELRETNYTYSISVVGKVKSDNYIILNSLTNDYLEFDIKVLAMPQNVKMEGYEIRYDQVTSATDGYAITGVTGATFVTEFDTSRDLDNELKSGSTYNLQVCAKGNGSNVLASNYSDAVKVHRLALPYDLKIDTSEQSGGRLSYEIEDEATGVELYLNSTKVEDNSAYLENMNPYITTQGTSVALKAVCNNVGSDGIYYMTSEISTSKMFIKLQTPKNLTVSNTALSWDLDGINDKKVGKISFRVYTGNEVQFSPEGSARSVVFGDKLEGGRDYTLKIKAIGDGEEFINSEYSDTISVYKLATPQVTKDIATGLYKWEGVTQAVSYAVTVDGVQAKTDYHTSVGDTYTYDPVADLTSIKTYKITVTAVGNNGAGGQKIISSDSFEIQQQVVQLEKCEIKLGYDRATYATNGNIVATVTKESENAKGYVYYFSGITYKRVVGEEDSAGETVTADSAKVCLYNPNNTGKYEVYAAAVGGTFTSEGAYTINSQNCDAKSITLLTTLDSNSTNSINLLDGTIRFSPVAGADKYSVKITVTLKDGTTGTATIDITQSIYLLSSNLKTILGDTSTATYNDVKAVEVEIQALGNATLETDGYYYGTTISGNVATNKWDNVH